LLCLWIIDQGKPLAGIFVASNQSSCKTQSRNFMLVSSGSDKCKTMIVTLNL